MIQAQSKPEQQSFFNVVHAKTGYLAQYELLVGEAPVTGGGYFGENLTQCSEGVIKTLKTLEAEGKHIDDQLPLTIRSVLRKEDEILGNKRLELGEIMFIAKKLTSARYGRPEGYIMTFNAELDLIESGIERR